MTDGFQPPPYPQERLGELRAVAAAHDGGAVDLSAGIPCDPPPRVVTAALSRLDSARPYPPSAGSDVFLGAARRWMSRRLGVDVDQDRIAACIGTKELVAGLPHWLRLRRPDRDTVLYPAVSYPTYAMGATLAGCRAVPVPADDRWCMDLAAIRDSDAERALCLWVNTPGNPAGGLDDLSAAAEWGRRHGVPVLSDECYVEFTWAGSPRTILASGSDGVVAIHSVSKRSNLAGLRVGFYAGDAEIVAYLREVRRHAGFMVPGPAQGAAAAALDDDEHVESQRTVYQRRLGRLGEILTAIGSEVPQPDGGFYLWAPVPAGSGNGDEWAFARHLAEAGGVVVTPGEIYTEGRPVGRIRAAVVQPDEAIERVAARLGVT